MAQGHRQRRAQRAELARVRAIGVLLGHSTSRRILLALAKGPADVRSLVVRLSLGESGLRRNLKRLVDAGLIATERQGVRNVYHLADTVLLKDSGGRGDIRLEVRTPRGSCIKLQVPRRAWSSKAARR